MKTIIKPSVCLSVLALLILAGCRKDDSQEFTDSPIVEAYLEPGSCLAVKVSRQIPFSSGVTYSSDDIDHLSIRVLVNDTSYVLTPLGDGSYADSSVIMREGSELNLSFTFNAKNVSAYTYIPSKPDGFTESATSIEIERTDSTTGPGMGTMPDPVGLTWDNPDASYYLVVVENIEESLDPIRDFGDEEPPGNMFRKSPTNASSEQIRPMDFQYFGTHRIILFHVLPDYAALYDRNSTSSQNLTNPSTSITNGYGIFTGMNSDTLYIEVSEP